MHKSHVQESLLEFACDGDVRKMLELAVASSSSAMIIGKEVKKQSNNSQVHKVQEGTQEVKEVMFFPVDSCSPQSRGNTRSLSSGGTCGQL